MLNPERCVGDPLGQAGFQQLAKLKQADPDVDLADRDVRSCNNPTFDGKNLNSNVLAEIAPQPAACDKVGAGPCGTATGTNEPSTDDPNAPSTDAGAGAGGGGGGGNGGAGSDAPGAIDPETGEVVGSDDTVGTGADAIYANPTELSADRAVDRRAFGWLAAVELIALVLLPGLFVAAMRRRKAAAAIGRAKA